MTTIQPIRYAITLCAVLATLAAQAQDQSKHITVVLATPLDNIDSCNMSAGYIGSALKQNIVETLTQLDPKDSAIVPRLALSWERRDANTWRIKLRQGVKFQDGSEFNAEAVSVAVARTLNPKLDCLDRVRVFPNIKLSTRIVDNATLDVVSDQPLALMPLYLAQLGIASPKTDGSRMTNNPVGTGPYMVQSFVPTQGLVVKRFDGYWGKKPEVQQATYLWRTESALRASMVAVGEADMATQIAPQDASAALGDVGYLNSETTRVRMVMQPPLDDIRVRKAMNLAINRAAFIGTVLSPKVITASQMMLPSTQGYDRDLKPWPHDAGEARRLIRESKAAGVPVEREITLYGRNGLYANQEEVLQSMAQMWNEAGLNIKFKMLDTTQWLKLSRKPYAENRPPMLIHEMHDNAYGDAAFTMPARYSSAGVNSDLSDPALDRLLEEGSAATGDKRRQIYQEANRHIQQKMVPDVVMYHMVSNIRVGPRVEYQPNLATNGKIELSDIRFKK